MSKLRIRPLTAQLISTFMSTLERFLPDQAVKISLIHVDTHPWKPITPTHSLSSPLPSVSVMARLKPWNMKSNGDGVIIVIFIVVVLTCADQILRNKNLKSKKS